MGVYNELVMRSCVFGADVSIDAHLRGRMGRCHREDRRRSREGERIRWGKKDDDRWVMYVSCWLDYSVEL